MLMNNVVFGNPSQKCVDVVIEYAGEMAIIHAKAKRVINRYVNPVTMKEYVHYVKKPNILQQMFGASLQTEVEKKIEEIKDNAETYLDFSVTGTVTKEKKKKRGLFGSIVNAIKQILV